MLFHIAEEPPAEMASLLGMFQTSVPVVVKRRAKELLKVVREGVKRGLNLTKDTGSVQSFGDDQEEEVVSTVDKPRKDVMLETEIKFLEMVEESRTMNLWGSGTYSSFCNGRELIGCRNSFGGSLGSTVIVIWAIALIMAFGIFVCYFGKHSFWISEHQFKSESSEISHIYLRNDPKLN